MTICAAYGCNVDSGTHRLSMFKFPRDPKKKKLWILKLNRGRTATTDFVPSTHSKLCVKHFDDQQFVVSPKLAREIGFKNFRLRLKPDAVPTIFTDTRRAEEDSTVTSRPSARAISKKKLKHEINTTMMSLRQSESTPCLDEQITAEFGEVYTAVSLFTSPSVAVTTSSVITTTASSTTTTTTTSVTGPSSLCSLTWFADLTSHLPKLPSSSSNKPTVVESQTVTEQNLMTTQKKQVTSHDMVSTSSQTPYNLVKRRSVVTQCTTVKTNEKSTQTSYIPGFPPKRAEEPQTENSFNDSFVSVESDKADPDWQPDSDHEMEVEYENPAKERKFIVFESCLDSLLSQCSTCGTSTCVKKRIIGSGLLCVIQCMNCDNMTKWQSQPFSGNMPLGNLILSAAVMFCGVSPVKVLRALDFASVVNISYSTFSLIQSTYLTPTIMTVWKKHQNSMIHNIRDKGRPLKLAGDMRCCSPGHTAKYGSYSILDLEEKQVLDFQLVQSNEVRNSYAMELEGLKRALVWIEEQQLTVTDLVTDRHSSVKKYMREERPCVNHWFDVWHVAKGVYKKLEAAGKKKGCVKVKDWARSISNHMYWCAASSGGDGELVQQKWLSILNHVVNIHSGHGDKFPNCEHGQLEDRDWFKKGFKPYAEVEKVVTGRLLVQDVKKLSPTEQTSSLESFHNVVCHFASKSVHYFYAQMEARLALAALHFNENSGRTQATTKDGSLIWRISFPKAKQGEGIAKQVKTEVTFSYVDELMECVLERRKDNQSYQRAKLANEGGPEKPKPIAHSTPRPKKDEIVKAHRARFNR